MSPLRAAEEEASREVHFIARNLALEAELIRVLQLLEPTRIVSFKGPLLTRKLYGDLSLRVSYDIDILVDRADAQLVLEKLFADGYQGGRFVERREDAWQALRSRKSSVNLFKGVGEHERSLDVHGDAFNPRLFQVSRELVEQHLEEAVIHGQKVLTFDTPLAFAHLITHFISHRFELSILRDIGHAWDQWVHELPSAEDEFWEQTCTREALEYVITASQRRGFAQRPAPLVRTQRAAQVLRFFPPEKIPEDESAAYQRGFWSTWLVNPKALPGQAWRGIYLSPQELAARYGEPASLRLAWRRLTAPVREFWGKPSVEKKGSAKK